VASQFDVAVIGGGVVGCAIAMELSRYTVSVALIEAKNDVGAATSKANSAILHTGFDAPPGSLEARLVARGYERFHRYRDQLGLPIGHTGALLIAWNDDQAAALRSIVAKAEKNGVSDLRAMDRKELYEKERHLGPGALAAVLVPGESITCPFTPPLAFALNAVRNGVTLFRNAPVTSVERGGGPWRLRCGEQNIEARTVVNAAGLFSDAIARLFGKTMFTVKPRKGEFLVFDKPVGRMIRHILLPVPTSRTKGVLLAPTVFGNLLLGPTAIDTDDKNDTSVSRASIGALLETGRRILPAIDGEDVTTTYAGLRAATEHQDYQIHFYPDEHYVTVGGIRSTGLSASLGISEYVVDHLIRQFGIKAGHNAHWTPHRAPSITNLALRVCEDAARILANPDYGAIVCHCELVSKGEIADALRGDLPALDTDGVKRRTRAMLGRCQGFHCSAHIQAMVNHGPH
jgi:glycerol-3-phosphate dehydrogenase